MISLLLTIACSTSIALILKYSSVNKGNSILLIASNYLVASIIGFVMFMIEPEAKFSFSSLIFGAVIGTVFVSSFFAFSKSIDVAGTALSTLSSRISLFIPVALSILLYSEIPTFFNLLGFAFAGITIYLFYLSLRHNKTRTITLKDILYLAGLMIGIGIGDFSMKVFQQTHPIVEKQFFIFSIFFFAFIYCFIIIFVKKIPLKRHTILSGSVLGVPNVLSSVFLIAALETIPGILVYPLVNIGVILLTALLAFIIWREKIDRLGLFSLFTGVVTIVLLTL
ncbi:MAG: hypothetical protein U5K00_15130 [Melioribacteraceae bacterium]|nr:hypothetical protein [Melioribacteraceae bacterium]